MKKYLFWFALFLIGTSSVPIIGIILEENYLSNIRGNYVIDDSSYGLYERNKQFQYNGNSIAIYADRIDEKPFERGILWFVKADIFININGMQITHLSDYAIPEYLEEGYSRAYNGIRFVHVKEKKTNDEYFAIIVNLSNNYLETKELKEQEFRLIKLYPDGTIVSEDFKYKNRTKLQSYLGSMVTPTSFGYYSDMPYKYPTLIVPIIYPFITEAIGILILVVLGLLKIISVIKNAR